MTVPRPSHCPESPAVACVGACLTPVPGTPSPVPNLLMRTSFTIWESPSELEPASRHPCRRWCSWCGTGRRAPWASCSIDRRA